MTHTENSLAKLKQDELIRTFDYQERLERTRVNIINDLTELCRVFTKLESGLYIVLHLMILSETR